MGIGIAFAGHLIRFSWLQLHTEPVAEQNFYALEDVMTIIDSPLWVVSGAMYLVVAASLLMLALPESKEAAIEREYPFPGAIAAVIGSACFLLLGISHLIGVPQIEILTESCAENGRTAVVAYNLIRTILLSSAFFALGWFLLLDAGRMLRSGVGPKSIHVVGLFAGVLCVLFVFSYTAAPLLFTPLMMVAVTVWGLGQALAKLVIR